MSHTFKILSLDGGGIKGLYTATVLGHLEEAFGVPVGQCFDMICGTSTGGLIALALAKGLPAKDLVAFYQQHGPSIFPTKRFLNGFRALFRQIARKGKYDNVYLKKALKGVLGQTLLSESHNLLCIPAFNLTAGRPRVFKFPHPEGGNYAGKYGTMLEAALATSAAPTYFPAVFADKRYYADGGVWANNPALCGILEALEYFVGTDQPLTGLNHGTRFTDYAVLSLACLPQKNGWAHTGTSHDLPLGFLDWRDRLFETSLDGQAHFADNFARKLMHHTKTPGHYHRIQGPKDVSAAQQALLQLDNASPQALQALAQLGDEVGDEYRTRSRHLIAPFFQHAKRYRTR